MIHVILGVIGCFMGIFGILTNLYILVVLLWNKKTRTSSEWILLHLSWCGFGGSIFHLCILSPSILREKFVLVSPTVPFCGLVGSGFLILQLVSVWSVCALSADRAIAIVYPLRYSQIATSRRIAVYFVAVWLLSATTVIAALFLSSFQEFHSPYIPVTQEQSDGSQTPVLSGGDIFSGTEELVLPVNPSYFPPHLNLNNNYNESMDSARIVDSDTNTNMIPVRMPMPRSPVPNPSPNATPTPTAAQQLIDQDTLTMMMMNVEVEEENLRRMTGSGSGSTYNQSSGNSTSSSSSSGSNNNSSSSSSSRDTEGPGKRKSVEYVVLNSRHSHLSRNLSFEFRPMLGICLPKVYKLSLSSVIWTSEWILFILIAPMCTLLVCDLAVLSIARRQSHRILLAMTMVTITAQATVTRSKGMAPAPPTGLWVNNIPARSRACRAVCEDLSTLILLHLPIILIVVSEAMTRNNLTLEPLVWLGSLSLFATPSCNALLYGIRARPLRTAYKSYLRKRLTNTTLQNEIQNRLSPVDGSPRPSSRAKSFRSSTPSPNSSPAQTPPRRLSSHDLRPPANQLILTTSPSHDHFGRNPRYHLHDEENNSTVRKFRSFLHIPSFPSQLDLQEFWSGLRRPNRSPTIVITHEISIKKDISNNILASPSEAEQRL